MFMCMALWYKSNKTWINDYSLSKHKNIKKPSQFFKEKNIWVIFYFWEANYQCNYQSWYLSTVKYSGWMSKGIPLPWDTKCMAAIERWPPTQVWLCSVHVSALVHFIWDNFYFFIFLYIFFFTPLWLLPVLQCTFKYLTPFVRSTNFNSELPVLASPPWMGVWLTDWTWKWWQFA